MSFRMSERSLFFVISFETILTLAHCIAYVNKIVLNNAIIVLMTTSFYSLLRDRKFKGLLLLVLIVLVIGMLFYSTVEHWRMLDALYFSVITLTTVGYGDFTPQTDPGKVFTIFYLLIGIGIILGLIAIIANHAIAHYSKVTENYVKRTEKFTESMIEKALHKK